MYSVEKTKGINFFKQFDYTLFTAVLLLAACGMFVLRSATLVMPGGGDGNRIMLMQSIGLALGIILALVLSFVDYKDFKTIGFIFYILSTCLLLLVLFAGTGKSQVGTNGWFNFMGVSFQPSELAKITLIVFISLFLERIKEGRKDRTANIIKFIVYSAIPIGLIALQPDVGTCMVFAFIILVMVFVAGIPYRYFLRALLVSLPLLAGSWFLMKPYQKSRILSFFSPDQYAQDSAYNVIRAKIAIGSGRIYGKGLYQGIQTQRGWVPVKASDFIFSVVGEELGFIGAAALIVLIFFILLRCIYIAKNSRDAYGSFLVMGITGMFAFHYIENIGMCIGLLPVTGIPLPFVSSGGSAMVTNFIAVGIVLSVSMRRKKTIFNNTQ